MKKPLLVVMLSTIAFLAAASVEANQESEGWDFVPGEKLLLYDDYSDMPKGAAPPHWKVRGGTLRLVDGRLAAGPGQASEMWPNVVKWPRNFTIEMDLLSSIKGVDDPASERRITWNFANGDAAVWSVSLAASGEGGCKLAVEILEAGEFQNVPCKFRTDQPNKYGIWVQDGRLRFYLNGERLMDLNQVKADFQTASLQLDNGPLPISMGHFRIAESAPDVSKTLFATGRYVTHGILFDVDSDAIRRESAPVLQQVADALTSQPTMKVRIEGHTDSTGNPAANLDLSTRRAESVKKELVRLGIAADRLTTGGFGDTKPAASNETPKGRAENRRVEFVKF